MPKSVRKGFGLVLKQAHEDDYEREIIDKGNVNLYIRQAEFDTKIPEFNTKISEFDTQIPEFDTWIRQESKLAPLSNI